MHGATCLVLSGKARLKSATLPGFGINNESNSPGDKAVPFFTKGEGNCLQSTVNTSCPHCQRPANHSPIPFQNGCEGGLEFFSRDHNQGQSSSGRKTGRQDYLHLVSDGLEIKSLHFLHYSLARSSEAHLLNWFLWIFIVPNPLWFTQWTVVKHHAGLWNLQLSVP